MVPWKIHGPHTCMNAKLQALLYGGLVRGQFVTRCPQPCLFLCVCVCLCVQLSDFRATLSLRVPSCPSSSTSHRASNFSSFWIRFASFSRLVNDLERDLGLVVAVAWSGGHAMQSCGAKRLPAGGTVSFAGLPSSSSSHPSVYVRLVFIRNRRRLF
jgi:hypothetical protein